jgi:hypothetical protein
MKSKKNGRNKHEINIIHAVRVQMFIGAEVFNENSFFLFLFL